MNQLQRHKFDRVKDISGRMLLLARENDWGQVAELEKQRQPLLQECFAKAHSNALAADIAAEINAILLLNNEVSALGALFRRSLGGDIQTRKVGRKASAAYRDCVRRG